MLVGWAAVTRNTGSAAPAVALAALDLPLDTAALPGRSRCMTETCNYDRAHIPMLPNVHGVPRTKNEILIYTIVMVAASIAVVPLGVFGAWYLVPAVVLGAIFSSSTPCGCSLAPTEGRTARTLFKYSLIATSR